MTDFQPAPQIAHSQIQNKSWKRQGRDDLGRILHSHAISGLSSRVVLPVKITQPLVCDMGVYLGC